MPRSLTLAVFAAVALTPVLAFPGPASADSAPIVASAGRVTLGANPWSPTGELSVEVRNTGATAQKGSFLVHLPDTATLEQAARCRPVDGGEPTWNCDTDPIPAGGTRTYPLTVRSTVPQPVFGTAVTGWVQGRSATGEAAPRVEFAVRWPDRLPLRLAATSGPVTGGQTDVDVRVTNAGTFTLGGYSLNIKTPAGVTVLSPECSDSGRMNGVGCEIYRAGPVNAGATDRFTVRLKASGTPVTVNLFLAPTNRYTNRDTSVDLTLTGNGGASAAPGVSAGPTASATPTGAALPVTGSGRTPILVGSGAAMVAAGAALLLGLRRRRSSAG